MKKTFLILLLLYGAFAACGQTQDTFEVYFPLNETKISKEASDHIDQLIFKDVLIPGQKLIVLGYADYIGDNKYNESLSAERAKQVQDYLTASGFTKKDIKLCIGKGKINRASSGGKEGNAEDRKVQIVIDRHPEPVVVAEPPKRPDTVTKTKNVTDMVAKRKNAPDIAHAKVNETIALKNLLFEPSNDRMLPESYPELEKLQAFLTDNKTVAIQIEGHICCMDPSLGTDEAYGRSTISVSRAKAVYDYLVKKGIDKSRLKYIGLGNTRPLKTPEITDDDRQQNRRVEIRILSK